MVEEEEGDSVDDDSEGTISGDDAEQDSDVDVDPVGSESDTAEPLVPLTLESLFAENVSDSPAAFTWESLFRAFADSSVEDFNDPVEAENMDTHDHVLADEWIRKISQKTVSCELSDLPEKEQVG